MNWRRFLHRDRTDADQKLELESYLETATEEFIARGMDPQSAREAARRKLGNVTQIREEVYRMNTLGHLEDIGRHVRFTLRTLAKNKAFAAIAILTLAIGIGANTAVFSVVNAILLKPLPYPKADRLVSISHTAPGAAGLAGMGTGLPLSQSMYFTYAEQSKTFEALGIWMPGVASITGIGEPEQVPVIAVSPGTLEALQVPPELGRWFSEQDHAFGTQETVLLSHGYWLQRFGGDRSVLGRTLEVDSRPRLIIGVMPTGFRIADASFSVVVPFQIDRSRTGLAGFGRNGIGRLRPGVTIAQANADIGRLIPIWMRSWSSLGGPGNDPTAISVYESWRITANVTPLRDTVVGNVGEVLWVIMGTLAVVMLIACANVANLLLVHVEGRRQELAVRVALGAGRGRIVRELLLESSVLSFAGALLGCGLAYGGLRLLQELGPANLPRLSEVALDGQSLFFTLVLATLASLLFALMPAWKISRHVSLSSESRTASASRERHRARNTLVVVQVALALVLLISSGLMIRTFDNLRHVDPGFSGAEQVQTMQVSVPRTLIAEPERAARIENEIQQKIAAIPGVTSVGFASAAPMDGSSPNWDGIFVEGQTMPNGAYPPMRVYRTASPGFFGSMGTRLVAGRDYTWDDMYNLRNGVIISENLAREWWGSPANAIGKRIRAIPIVDWREIIGVVQDVRISGAHQPAPSIVYWPVYGPAIYRQPTAMVERNPVYTIRSARAGTQAFLEEVRRAVWSTNASLAIANERTQSQIMRRSFARTSFTLVMLAIAGTMALVLGVIGIYGVLSYSVAQRRREAGIRIALGAAPAAVSAMFVRHGLVLSGIGIAAGLIAAAALTRWMSALLFGVEALDPMTYATTAGLLLIAAAAACYIPARRAAAVNPAETMRGE